MVFKDNIQGIFGTGPLTNKNYWILVQKDGANASTQVIIIGDDPCDVKMALNKFTDLTQEEFQNFYLIPK